MRYLMVHRIDESKPDAYKPTPELMAGMGALLGEMTKAGVLLAAEGVAHSSKGARIRVASGKETVTDGPFTEAKWVIGGFALIHCRSLDEANVVGDTEFEIREVSEFR